MLIMVFGRSLNEVLKKARLYPIFLLAILFAIWTSTLQVRADDAGTSAGQARLTRVSDLVVMLNSHDKEQRAIASAELLRIGKPALI